MRISPWISRLAAIGIFVLILPLLGLSSMDLRQRQISALRILSQEGYHLPPPSALRALSFGFNELGADLLWIRTIIYFSDHLVTDHDLRYLRHHLENILALDVRFKEVYRYGAAMLMSQGHRQTNEQVLTAIDLLKRAHRLWPRDWRYPLFIGAYYMNELKSSVKEQRDLWRRTGADWIRRSTLVGAAISWLPALAANIYSEQGQRELAIRHLQELYLVTQNKKMRHQIASKLRHLKAQKLTLQLRNAAKAFKRAKRDSALQFVPDDLFALLSQERLEPFSLAKLANLTR